MEISNKNLSATLDYFYMMTTLDNLIFHFDHIHIHNHRGR